MVYFITDKTIDNQDQLLNLFHIEKQIEKINSIIENKSVALIGPALTLENKNIGSEIDKYDFIINLNHIKYSNIDHGSRCDFLFERGYVTYISRKYEVEKLNKSDVLDIIAKYREYLDKKKCKYIVAFHDFPYISYSDKIIKFFNEIYDINFDKSDISNPFIINKFFNILGIDCKREIIIIPDLSQYLYNQHNIKNITGKQFGLYVIFFINLLKIKKLFIAGLTWGRDYVHLYDTFNGTLGVKQDAITREIILDKKYYDNKETHNFLVEEDDFISDIKTNKYNNKIFMSVGVHKLGRKSLHFEKIFIKYLFRDSNIENIILFNDFAYSFFMNPQILNLKFNSSEKKNKNKVIFFLEREKMNTLFQNNNNYNHNNDSVFQFINVNKKNNYVDILDYILDYRYFNYFFDAKAKEEADKAKVEAYKKRKKKKIKNKLKKIFGF